MGFKEESVCVCVCVFLTCDLCIWFYLFYQIYSKAGTVKAVKFDHATLAGIELQDLLL